MITFKLQSTNCATFNVDDTTTQWSQLRNAGEDFLNLRVQPSNSNHSNVTDVNFQEGNLCQGRRVASFRPLKPQMATAKSN